MNREICGQCDSPLELCECFDIFTHKRWCNHCRDHVNLKTHYQTCEFASLQKEVENLREELMAAYSPKP